ncbi:MAG: hypothetical protein ABJE10_06605 [bacterium]
MMNSAVRWMLLAPLMMLPASLQAQTPWGVTIIPSANPIAIGGCTLVSLNLLDSTGKDVPKNPMGQRVSIADFDMTITSANPKAVAGEYNGASSWSACACQGAAVGSAATITASYPAKMLAPAKRVRGVAFHASTAVTIAKPRGAADVAACQALKNPTKVAPGPAEEVSQEVVVVRTEFPVLFQGNISLSPGYCDVVYGTFVDPDILFTRAVVVAVQPPNPVDQLKWTAAVNSESTAINACTDQKAIQMAVAGNGRRKAE